MYCTKLLLAYRIGKGTKVFSLMVKGDIVDIDKNSITSVRVINHYFFKVMIYLYVCQSSRKAAVPTSYCQIGALINNQSVVLHNNHWRILNNQCELIHIIIIINTVLGVISAGDTVDDVPIVPPLHQDDQPAQGHICTV